LNLIASQALSGSASVALRTTLDLTLHLGPKAEVQLANQGFGRRTRPDIRIKVPAPVVGAESKIFPCALGRLFVKQEMDFS